MEIYLEIGALMEKHKMTNQSMADASGVPIGTVSGIRSGKVQNPGFESVCAMIKAMGESVDELVGIAPPCPAPEAPASSQHPPVSLIREEVVSACRGAIRDVLESFAHKSQHGNLVWWR